MVVQTPFGSILPIQYLTVYRIVTHLWGLPCWLGRRRLGDHPQIVVYHAPAHPAFHPGSAGIAAPIQLVASFQAADAALNARTPVVTPPEPPLLLMGHPCGRLGPGLGKYRLFDPVRGGILLVRGRMNAPISGEQPRGAFEQVHMMVQTRRQLGVLRRIAVQDGVPADNAALDFVQPE